VAASQKAPTSLPVDCRPLTGRMPSATAPKPSKITHGGTPISIAPRLAGLAMSTQAPCGYALGLMRRGTWAGSESECDELHC
jgi:hypothetical protein